MFFYVLINISCINKDRSEWYSFRYWKAFYFLLYFINDVYTNIYSWLDFTKIKTIGLKNYMTNKFRGKRNKTEILINKDIDNIHFDKFTMFREGKNKEVVMRHWNRTAKYLKMIKKVAINFLRSKGYLRLTTANFSHCWVWR